MCRSYAKETAAYLRTAYDWRGQEAALHEHPQFTTEVDGQTIRFLHARSPTHTPTAATGRCLSCGCSVQRQGIRRRPSAPTAGCSRCPPLPRTTTTAGAVCSSPRSPCRVR
ncbi:epoxide hydrolase N-terminal domain-containing protein [Nonomuraea sp. NPDC050383]|uniref:epoxide hydrolase N-terminal domain-containing protein n=1 Tax=Nonomuraea sp. NPDC050383 TaxID=3364362 RepID=UPI0037B978AC